MATDFNKNTIAVSGGIRPVTTNTPIDVRTRIETISEVENIPLPFVGMIFYVIDEDKYYSVKTLKGKKITSSITKPNMLVDEFEELVSDQDLSHLATKDEMKELVGSAPESMDTLGEIASILDSYRAELEALRALVEATPKMEFTEEGDLVLTINGVTKTFAPKGAIVDVEEGSMTISGVPVNYVEERNALEIEDTFLSYEEETENLVIRDCE